MLIDYFANLNYQQALRSYQDFSDKRDWPIRCRLKLYNLAKKAFKTNVAQTERENAFSTLFRELECHWQVFRKNPPIWSPEYTFRIFQNLPERVSRQSNLTLMTLSKDDYDRVLIEGVLEQLRNFKPNKEFPWMAVSKFLHFYNPSLFPIWDKCWIWDVVMQKTFKQEYRTWCKENAFKPNETSKVFNYQYTLWASEYIHRASADFMSFFEKWFQEQVKGVENENHTLDDVHVYYATAFEFVVLGAADSLTHR